MNTKLANDTQKWLIHESQPTISFISELNVNYGFANFCYVIHFIVEFLDNAIKPTGDGDRGL